MTAEKAHPLLILIKGRLARFSQALHDDPAFKWISRRRKHLASIPYMLLVAGFGCWIYSLLDLEIGSPVSSEAGKVLALLILAASGSASVLACTSLLSRSAYSLFLKRSFIQPLKRLSPFVRPLCFAAMLFAAFTYGDHIRTAGVATYPHVAGFVRTSQLHTEAVKRSLPDMREIVQGIEVEDKRNIHDFYRFRTYKR